jgi:hypothetical protein
MKSPPSLSHPSPACRPGVLVAHSGLQDATSTKRLIAVVPMFFMRASARRFGIPYVRPIVRKTLNGRWAGSGLRRERLHLTAEIAALPAGKSDHSSYPNNSVDHGSRPLLAPVPMGCRVNVKGSVAVGFVLNAIESAGLTRRQLAASESGLRKSSRVSQGSSCSFLASNNPELDCRVVRPACSDPRSGNRHA